MSRLEDFSVMKGESGLEFFEFAKGLAKTKPGGLSAKPRQFQPRMFQTGERNLQLPYFVSTSAVNLPISGRVFHFISRLKYNRRADNGIRYKVQPMEENKSTPR